MIDKILEFISFESYYYAGSIAGEINENFVSHYYIEKHQTFGVSYDYII